MTPEASPPFQSVLDRRSDSAVQVLPDLLRVLRTHLDMEVAFIAQFQDGERVFRYVDEGPDVHLLQPGQSGPLEESYCQRVVDGRLPALIRDAQRLPAALELSVTRQLPVGAHVSVPIRLGDGSVYGTFCCFSRKPHPRLQDAVVASMHMLADVASGFIEREQVLARAQISRRREIEAVLREDAVQTLYQPIRGIRNLSLLGFEALSRFPVPPLRGPDVWFNEAVPVGMGAALELHAIGKALAALPRIPSSAYLSCNASPEAIMAPGLAELLKEVPVHRVLLEVTEHADVADYDELARALAPLKRRGLRLAVDDAGAGYASFRHILRLAPDVIKLDLSLTRSIDADPTRRALASAFARFAQETGSLLVAEGVETQSELTTLKELGIQAVQGYFVGRPAPLPSTPA